MLLNVVGCGGALMWFGLLGPLTVTTDEGTQTTLSGTRQRVLLAALLLRANHPVPADELVDLLWSDAGSFESTATLRSAVRRLRHTLGPGPASRIVAAAPGYLIRVHDSELDVSQFETLCRQASAAVRAGGWAEAVRAATQALELWRDPPLLDVPSPMLRQQFEPRLEQLRVQALEDQAESRLNLGEYDRVAAHLVDVTAQYPLREKFHAQLMLALTRTGRQAEALEVYRAARRILVEQLGVEPGQELRRLHERILAGQEEPDQDAPTGRPAASAAAHAAAAAPIPRQLPAAVPHFTGRRIELDALTALLDKAATNAAVTVVVSAIDGMAGVGKTALAIHWARHASDAFPDGQLYINLRGFDPAGSPLPAASVVRRFLEALGVKPALIPADPEAQFDLYRSLAADRRMLIVLDNARDAEQVRPLLPGNGGCLVLVTSRNSLTGLVALDGAVPLTMNLLTREEARALLARRLGAERVSHEAQAVDELIELCNRLPLALNLAAAHAAIRPRTPLAVLVERLRDVRERMSALSGDEQAADIAAVFSWSYRALDCDVARMFRLLGLHPGPEIAPPAAASLAGVSAEQAGQQLAELARAHLVTEETPGRFALHDLMRAYAEQQARNEAQEAEGEQESRRAAIRRTLDHYLATATRAAQLLDGDRMPTDTPPAAAGVLPEQLSDAHHALDWLAVEYRVLLRLVELAAKTGFDVHAWQLARALVSQFNRRALWQDWDHTHAIAAAAAARLGDARAEALITMTWSRCLVFQGRPQQAQQYLHRALRLFEELDDRSGQARVLIHLGLAARHADDYERAIAWTQRAYELYVRLGERDGQAGALSNLGIYHRRTGDPDQARRVLEQALELSTELGDRRGQAMVANNLGLTYHALGDYREAIAYHRAAVEIIEELGLAANHAEALGELADAYHADGQVTQAIDAYNAALAILIELGHPGAAEIRSRLDALEFSRSTRRQPEPPSED